MVGNHYVHNTSTLSVDSGDTAGTKHPRDEMSTNGLYPVRTLHHAAHHAAQNIAALFMSQHVERQALIPMHV